MSRSVGTSGGVGVALEPDEVATTSVTARKRLDERRSLVLALQVAIALVIVLVWQWLTTSGAVNASVFPPPSKVFDSLWQLVTSGKLGSNLGATLEVLVIGYVIGIGVGIVAGILLGVSTFANAFLGPFLAFLNAVPRLLLIPFFIVLFGVGVVPQILVVILVIVVVVAVTVQAGVQGIQGDYIRNARALGANGAQLLSSVYVPGVSIWVISSARLTVGMAFQAAVVAEFFGSANGLGYLIDDGLQTFNAPQIYAAVIVTAVLALLVDFGLGFVERRYSRWLPGGRNGS